MQFIQSENNHFFKKNVQEFNFKAFSSFDFS